MAVLVKSLTEAGPIASHSDSVQIRSGLVVLGRGEEVGRHETGNGEELIILLEGSAELLCDGESKIIDAPVAVLVPAHTPHNVRNRSTNPLRYVYVYVNALDNP